MIIVGFALSTNTQRSETFAAGTKTYGQSSTYDINAGNIDGTIIGQASPAAITGTTIVATGDITGDNIVKGTDPDVDGADEFGIDSDNYNMRGYYTPDTIQANFARLTKVVNLTITDPDELPTTTNFPLNWQNESGFDFVIENFKAYADVDDYTATISEHSDPTDMDTYTDVISVTCSSDGTSVYYTETNGMDITFENGHSFSLTVGGTDAEYVRFVFIGYEKAE